MVEEYVNGIDCPDVDPTDFYQESFLLNGPFSTNTRLRFRCDASANGDDLYIDEVLFEGLIP